MCKICLKGDFMKLYFYHLVNKGSDLSRGLLSLQYMYDYNMHDLFFKYSNKYRKRIVCDWGLFKYKSRRPESLSYDEIIDGLNLFRGHDGSRCIYFFRYPPYKELGPRMHEILNFKDIYRIDINDEKVRECIQSIFWGYENSFSANPILDKKYYEEVSCKAYFSMYDDSLGMNFSTINHIAIVFKDDYCPIEFLEKV